MPRSWLVMRGDVKSVQDDLNEIEELERLAYAFAAKHIPEPEEPIEATPEAIAVLEPGPEKALPTSPQSTFPAAMRSSRKATRMPSWNRRMGPNPPSWNY